jgi:hypothetical protein
MIGQYLPNKNESTAMSKSKKNSKLNKARDQIIRFLLTDANSRYIFLNELPEIYLLSKNASYIYIHIHIYI